MVPEAPPLPLPPPHPPPSSRGVDGAGEVVVGSSEACPQPLLLSEIPPSSTLSPTTETGPFSALSMSHLAGRLQNFQSSKLLGNSHLTGEHLTK